MGHISLSSRFPSGLARKMKWEKSIKSIPSLVLMFPSQMSSILVAIDGRAKGEGSITE